MKIDSRTRFAFAAGAAAMGFLAVGALAIGRLAVRRMAIRNSVLKSVEIEELDVQVFRIGALVMSKTPTLAEDGGATEFPRSG